MTEIERVRGEICALERMLAHYEKKVTRITAQLRERRAYLANLEAAAEKKGEPT